MVEGVKRVQLRDWLELELPDGSVVKVRPGPYGKGLSVLPVNAEAKPKRTAPTRGKRGRKPRPSTLKLRERLTADATSDELKPAKDYVKWLLRTDPEVSLSVARQVVYRERRLVA